MELIEIILTIAGLALFETISSIDNAVVNAEVLAKMSDNAKRWFLTYGILIAVFILRLGLPLTIVWITNPSLAPLDILNAAFNSDPKVIEAIEASSPILLIGGGIFLVFLFFHWLFIEPKHFGLPKAEEFFMKKGVWFYAVISILLTLIVWFALDKNPMMAFGAVAGSTAFFITHGFKQNAEEKEKEMMGTDSKVMSDLSKILYLEVIDATFSVDGVVGAFAFTLSVPLIMIGSGLGAFIVRKITMGNIENVKKYKYLKNGAMYSILFLGLVMILDAFAVHIPEFVSPIATFVIIGYFFYRSRKINMVATN